MPATSAGSHRLGPNQASPPTLLDRYFLLGAAGALVSRLTRVLARRPSASDYGAGWSTLIVSPAAGALAGWLGVLIVVALAGDPLNVLDDRFGVLWDDAADVLGLVAAFAFGFSERLFDRLLETTTTKFTDVLPKGAGREGRESQRADADSKSKPDSGTDRGGRSGERTP